MNTKTFAVVLIVMAALIGGGFYFTANHGLLSGETLNIAEAKAEADYKSAGLPWTNAEVKGTAVPTGTKVMKVLNIFPKVTAVPSKMEEKVEKDFLAGDYSKAKDELIPVDSQLDRVTRLVKTRDLYFGYDFDQGATLVLPELANMKTYVKYLCLRGTAKAGTGDMTGCLEDFRSAIAIRSLPEKCPHIIGLLVELAQSHLIQRNLASAAAALKGSPEKLATLLALLPPTEPQMPLEQAYAADAYMEIASSRNWKSMMSKGSMILPDGWPSDIKSANYELRNARYWAAFFKGVGTKWNDRDAVSSALSKASLEYPPLKNQGKDYDAYFGNGNFEVANVALDRSHDNLINLYFSAIQYQVKHGKPPANLDEVAKKGEMVEAKHYSIKSQPGGFVVIGHSLGGAEMGRKINMSFPPAKDDRW